MSNYGSSICNLCTTSPLCGFFYVSPVSSIPHRSTDLQHIHCPTNRPSEFTSGPAVYMSVPMREVYMFQVWSGSELARSVGRAVYMRVHFPTGSETYTLPAREQTYATQFTSRPDLQHIHFPTDRATRDIYHFPMHMSVWCGICLFPCGKCICFRSGWEVNPLGRLVWQWHGNTLYIYTARPSDRASSLPDRT